MVITVKIAVTETLFKRGTTILAYTAEKVIK